MWGALPHAVFADLRTTRWSLGASDIIFKNDACRWFFHQGQTLEVLRGAGVFQPAIDTAIAKLNEARWVHIFPEGRVNLTSSAFLLRFKWGIARMALEARRMPLIVPVWLTGFDQIMPAHRAHPRWLPRLGADVTVTFGTPIDLARLEPFAQAYAAGTADVPFPELADVPAAHLYPEHPAVLRDGDAPAYAALRSRLAAFLRAQLAQHGAAARRLHGMGEGEGILAHRPGVPV